MYNFIKLTNVIDKCRNDVTYAYRQIMESALPGVKIKNQIIQTDMLRQASNILKVTACLDDDVAGKINEIVYQLDDLADEMEENIGADIHVPSQMPKLTIV